ncbi:Glycerol kinase [Micractinium conductrix]|uniref:glycerol kinase n=1 Tax=Micractinium conductrix TaxID=554055 RepID=A0A2P6VHJ7_9CHLO|nr:Glycerol kinase [Micractinium conductrix]|eukprot:PSC73566.1 Glycerol kinase [Micractinium conductrix]
MECVGAIDQGTQSTRFFLYDRNCQPLASAQVEFPQIYPRAGWVEQCPLAIWASVQEAVGTALEQALAQHGELVVKAVGITNQRETTIVWDRETGQPLHNAIVWLDNRTAPVCHALQKQLGSQDYFRPVTGLPISTYFSAYKLKWLLDNVPAVAQAAAEGRAAFGTVDSWLIWQLTGGAAGGLHATDVSNASRTNLMDLQALSWHQPTLELFGVAPRMLPQIRSNAEVYGTVKDGPLAGVPIAGCLGDQQAAMVGQRCAVHEAKNTYGTGCFMLLNTGQELVQSSHGLLSTLAFQLGADAAPHYALEGSIAIAGQGVSWLRDAVGFIGSAAESETVAASVPDTGGVYFVPAFGGLLAPWWQSDARGVIAGLTQYTTKAHIVRAMLEAVCFQTLDVLDAMQQDADCSELGAMFVDGGASQNNLLMQMQADILQVPVRRPAHLETTSLGAALAAGIGAGVWTAEEAFVDLKHNTGGTLFEPQITRTAAERRHAKWKLVVQRSFALAELTADLECDSEQRPEAGGKGSAGSGSAAAAPAGPEAA